MDQTLIHELAHAFVADLSRGSAPREIHEGLAQYMEGKRLGEVLTEQQITGLADGRVAGVAGFYLAASALRRAPHRAARDGRDGRPAAGHGRDRQRRQGVPAGARPGPARRAPGLGPAPPQQYGSYGELADLRGRKAGLAERLSDRGGARRRATASRAGRAAAASSAPSSWRSRIVSKQALALGQLDQPDLLVLPDLAPAPWPRRAPRRGRQDGPPGRCASPPPRSRRGPGRRRAPRPAACAGPWRPSR